MKVLKFWAAWCSPCKVLKTTLNGFDKCEITEINIEEDSILTNKFAVRKLLTLIIIDDNEEELWRHTGVISKMQLEQAIANIK